MSAVLRAVSSQPGGTARCLATPSPGDAPVCHALALAHPDIGWHVFAVHGIEGGRCTCGDAACIKPGKHPIHKGGGRGASVDLANIRRTFMRYPGANLAVHPGKSGLLVLDIDPRHGGDGTLAALEARHGRLDPAIAARTGGGGQHLYFLAPPPGISMPGTLGPGIDVLHGNRYPVIAPSLHHSGTRYEWGPNRDPFTSTALLVPPPDWVFGAPGEDRSAATPVAEDGDDWTTGIPFAGMEETPENETRLRSALEYVSAHCSRDEWRDVLFAINSTGWDRAEEIAREWSMMAPDLWDEGAFRNIWDSSKADRPGGRTVASVFHAAKRNGWRERGQYSPDTLGDLSNGRRFAERHHDRLLFVRAERAWRRWDGLRWARCDAGEEMHAAKDIADELLAEAVNAFTRDPSDANKRRHALTLGIHRSATRLREMVAMAASEPGMSVPDPTAFDADPWLLGVRNGVMDLRAGRLLAAEPGQRISRQAGAAFRPDATCPRWLDFLRSVFGDAEIVAFIQRATGYTLTGLVDEEKLFFAQGSGANGKSVFANVMCGVLGDYAVSVGSELLARSKHEGEAARYKQRLPGARLALANEVGEGDTWDDHRMKELVSRERIAARALYGEAYDFMPSHKLWVRGNHKPGILDAGDGMWRRIVLLSFERQFPAAERVPDLDRQLLDVERDGILRWMVQGCLAWQRGGLEVPASIDRATTEYRSESDVLGGWIAERCEPHPGERLEVARAFADFQQYSRDAGMAAPSRPAFVRRMGQRGFTRTRSNGADFLHDLAFRPPAASFEGGGDGGL